MIESTIDLPFPPSTNKLWRKTPRGIGMMLSKEYLAWKKNADKRLMANRGLAGRKKITGPFTAHLTLRSSGRDIGGINQRGDLDNKIKAVLDYAQRVELIADDKFCERLLVEWGEAPEGCRLILRSMEAA